MDEIAVRLRTYIDAELKDSALYKALSMMAPNDDDRQLLMEFAEDERNHAITFQRLYRSMTGRSYNPTIGTPQIIGSYKDILRERVIDESGDFRKYGEQYLQTKHSEDLKNAFYRARTDENVHALRLLYMLSKYIR